MTNTYIHLDTLARLATKHNIRISMSRVDQQSRFDALSDVRAAVELDGRRYYINFPDLTSEMVIKTCETWEETFEHYAARHAAIQDNVDEMLKDDLF